MNGNKLMQQVAAIFSVFMVLFYLGVGVFFIWYSDKSNIDEPVRVLLGAAFLLYGAFRGFRAWLKLREAYSPEEKNEDEERERYHSRGHYNR